MIKQLVAATALVAFSTAAHAEYVQYTAEDGSVIGYDSTWGLIDIDGVEIMEVEALGAQEYAADSILSVFAEMYESGSLTATTTAAQTNQILANTISGINADLKAAKKDAANYKKWWLARKKQVKKVQNYVDTFDTEYTGSFPSATNMVTGDNFDSDKADNVFSTSYQSGSIWTGKKTNITSVVYNGVKLSGFGEIQLRGHGGANEWRFNKMIDKLAEAAYDDGYHDGWKDGYKAGWNAASEEMVADIKGIVD